MTNPKPVRLLFTSALLLFFVLSAQGQQYRVYQTVVRAASGTIDEVESNLSSAAEESGWKVLAVTDAGAPEDCTYGARVIALTNPVYASQLMDINRNTAPFAIVDRINLFQDEDGLHVSIVNPHSVNRTVLEDDLAYAELTEAHTQALRSLVSDAVEGTATSTGYGQGRKRGYIGKTMGVMAGGKFSDKIQNKLVVPNADLLDVTEKVKEGMREEGAKWGLTLTYELPLPEYNVVVLGSTGRRMESKSFSIVKAGSDKSRKGYACPGLAHAGAYPIEVVVTKQGSDVEVQFVDAMYRMKMYFEDAGKMAFMKNMRMPGSLADELRDQIRLRFADNLQ